jgi:hypothetical protein
VEPLSNGGKPIHLEKEREEDESSKIVETGCIRLEIVRHASQDERHKNVKREAMVKSRSVSNLR